MHFNKFISLSEYFQTKTSLESFFKDLFSKMKCLFIRQIMDVDFRFYITAEGCCGFRWFNWVHLNNFASFWGYFWSFVFIVSNFCGFLLTVVFVFVLLFIEIKLCALTFQEGEGSSYTPHYLLKINNRSTRKMLELCSKLTI